MDESLDCIVDSEPRVQPYLRAFLNSPTLTEGWKQSATNKGAVPNSDEQTVSTRKALIHDHCLIRLLPYHPQTWVARAATFLMLGYGELAVADAYKTRMLCDATRVEAMKAHEPDDGSLTAKVLQSLLSQLPQEEDQSDEEYYLIVFSSIKKTEERAFRIMAQGLMCIMAWHDAADVLREATKAFPSNEEFKTMLVTLKQSTVQLKKDLVRIHGADEDMIAKTLRGGLVDRVAYPWIVPEELARSGKGIKRVKAQFEAASAIACIQRSPLDGDNPPHEGAREENYGVFAKRDIRKGERILFTNTVYTESGTHNGGDYCSACCQVLGRNAIKVTCCGSRFCSEICRLEATKLYHNALCGKDFSWLYQAWEEVVVQSTEMAPLLMLKVLGTAVHSNCKPLKVACVGTFKPAYNSETLVYYRLFDNIIAPVKILQTLGVDVFKDLKFDFWALQTLFMRIEDNKVCSTDGHRMHCGIDPLFSMLNHSCSPSAGYSGPEWSTSVTALRDIKEGEEVCISYVDLRLPDEEKVQAIRRHIGGMCQCTECSRAREAEEIGGKP